MAEDRTGAPRRRGQSDRAAPQSERVGDERETVANNRDTAPHVPTEPTDDRETVEAGGKAGTRSVEGRDAEPNGQPGKPVAPADKRVMAKNLDTFLHDESPA